MNSQFLRAALYGAFLLLSSSFSRSPGKGLVQNRRFRPRTSECPELGRRPTDISGLQELGYIFGKTNSCTLHSQEKTFSVGGRIVDAKSGQPMAGASVFCQNTTIGTLSKSDGTFSMRLANGGYDMIVSYTGYETRNIRINKDLKDKDSLVIELKEEDKSMEQVVVAGSAEVADGWDKYGQFFLDNFIGTTPFAAQCTLENKDALKFYF